MPRLDFGQIQNIADDAQQMLTTAVNCLQILFLQLCQRPIQPFEHDFGEADNRVERGAKLVAHAGQKGCFEPVYLGQPIGRGL